MKRLSKAQSFEENLVNDRKNRKSWTKKWFKSWMWIYPTGSPRPFGPGLPDGPSGYGINGMNMYNTLGGNDFYSRVNLTGKDLKNFFSLSSTFYFSTLQNDVSTQMAPPHQSSKPPTFVHLHKKNSFRCCKLPKKKNETNCVEKPKSKILFFGGRKRRKFILCVAPKWTQAFDSVNNKKKRDFSLFVVFGHLCTDSPGSII